MTKNWEEFRANHADAGITHDLDELAIFFEKNLVEHLTKQQGQVKNKSHRNQPFKILKAAQTNTAELSRIFDEFEFPVPSYDQIKEKIKVPNALRKHMQEVIDKTLPKLLNDNKDRLNPKIIDAINETHEDNYKNILAKAGSEHEIAEQFVKAVIIGYGERILDKTEDFRTKKEVNESLLTALSLLANQVTLTGLPERPNLEVSTLKNMIGDFRNLLRVNDAFFDSTISGILDTGEDWLDFPTLSDDDKIGKALPSYDKAVNLTLAKTEDTLKNNPPNPKEVSWFIKLLRFITRNEKLLQNLDEKRYEKQIVLLPKLREVKTKLDEIGSHEKGQEQEKGQGQEHPKFRS